MWRIKGYVIGIGFFLALPIVAAVLVGCAESYETIRARELKRMEEAGLLQQYGIDLDEAIEAREASAESAGASTR